MSKIKFFSKKEIEKREMDKQKEEELCCFSFGDNKQKVISLLIALVCLILSTSEGMETFLMVLAYLALPLGLIWFGDEVGGFLGTAQGPVSVNQTTPGSIIRFMGWLFLFLPILIGIVSYIN